MSYLSPAFHSRSKDELSFLKNVDDTTGFSLFWLDVVGPLLGHVRARHLLEIGADKGTHTRFLIKYCDACDGTLTVIDPVVPPSLKKIVEGSTSARLMQEMSSDGLPKIDHPVDAVLLEGDLNYYTVLGDLAGIEGLCKRNNTSFPVIFVKNTSWPYARRDMYYFPEAIPADQRHAYDHNGITPWSSDLQHGGLNSPFANAQREGGSKNGVLTAVEDFIKLSSFSLSLFYLPLYYGLGIIYCRNSSVADYVKQNLQPPPALALFLDTAEIARINGIIKDVQSAGGARKSEKLLTKGLRRLGQFIIKRIEK